ncbi:hypothetical protein COJ85_25275 [Bacillus sp. AFS076308]|uniref:hypothetical protein n=1 Tax=unclassified Bacillus (in: firmicutes) TaxID=185979 RepID=UPI000BF9FB45|nr:MULTISPECIES: hypothetical protein [unclassified Bacillus (in: firmicutes)]PFN95892.1 hypothetical protein COJ85_25275 [Bacillus sp. AFS076308]PGV49231.1 hypothetical protein COD92_22900 [Bacillus sp. AFS037270]
MGKVRKKFSAAQIFFVATFVATANTVSNSFVIWDNKIELGLFSGFTFVVGLVLAIIIFKQKE